MADYTGLTATASRLIAAKGFVATIQGAPTASDPVTGAGGSDGATRTLNAVKVGADKRAFSETLIERSTCMLICDGEVRASEFWLDGGAPRPIIAVMPVDPDNTSHIITKALIGG